MVPSRLILLFVTIGVISSLPLTVKRLIKPRSIEDFFRLRSPTEKTKAPEIGGIEIEWSLDDKQRLFDFESPATRRALEEFPSAHLLSGKDNFDPGADGLPTAPGMERAEWKELLEPELYQDLVREMRVPVKSFDERRYNALLRDLDLYRTQNYWETTRPQLEKRLAACSNEAERLALEEKINEFHELSYQRILYYRKLPRRTQERDFSKYYDSRVKGAEELRHVPPFALIQHAVTEHAERHGEALPATDDAGRKHIDRYYYDNYREVPETNENDHSEADDVYLPALNEAESSTTRDRDALSKDKRQKESKVMTMNRDLSKHISDRSLFYRLLLEKARQVYDFMLYIHKKPTKGDLTSAGIVAGVILWLSFVQLTSKMSPYYVTLGHLSLVSKLVSRGQPVDKDPMAVLMSKINPQITWSPGTLKLGLMIAAASVVPFTALFFAVLNALPLQQLSWGLRFKLAYTFSLIPTWLWTAQFQIFESKKDSGKLIRSFYDNMRYAREKQQLQIKQKDTEELTLKLGQSISDYLAENDDQLPTYQEYSYEIDPEPQPEHKYYDQYQDDLKKKIKGYEPRLYQDEAYSPDEKKVKSARDNVKQIRNVQAEVDQLKEPVKQFFEHRAEKIRRWKVTDDFPTPQVEKIMGVKEGFLMGNEKVKSWVTNTRERNEQRAEQYRQQFVYEDSDSSPQLPKPENKRKQKKVVIGEFGFRDRRPQWYIDLFGAEEQDQIQPIQEDFMKTFAKKYGFYRRAHYQNDHDVPIYDVDIE